MEENKKPISDKEIPNNPDAKIDQDFPGYPHAPSKKKLINPQTEKDKKLADHHEKDGEKRQDMDNDESDDLQDDGSANAFDRADKG